MTEPFYPLLKWVGATVLVDGEARMVVGRVVGRTFEAQPRYDIAADRIYQNVPARHVCAFEHQLEPAAAAQA
jgi:hypothetical protein